MNEKNRRQFLKLLTGAAGSIAALSAFPPSIRKALAVSPEVVTGTIEDVGHVVILMQENRSFDHYFGTMRGVRGFADRFPIPLAGGTTVWSQPTGTGAVVSPFHLDTRTTSAQRVQDLPHRWQDAQGAVNHGRWDRWVPNKSALSMGYYRREDIPFQFALADAFTLCDAYHCSVHGSTSPNRLFLAAGTNDPRGIGGGPVIGNGSAGSLGEYRDASMQEEADKLAKQYGYTFPNGFGSGPRHTFKTYAERLEEAGISWKVYQDPKNNMNGFCNPLVSFAQFWDIPKTSPLWVKGMSLWTLDDLKQDVMADRLPQVTWIIPSGIDSEHPFSSSPIQGADYTQRVLDALTANPKVWGKTVLFLNFDENDGFFDHAVAPSPPGYNTDGSWAGKSTVDFIDEIHPVQKLTFGLGPRVPMYVISPWSKGGWVNSQVFDHTSVIRFLEQRFGVMEPNISAWRRSVCGDLTSAFDFASPQGVSVPLLPDASQSAAIVQIQSKLPAPNPPEQAQQLFQESGWRYSRALPYELQASIRKGSAPDSVALQFDNAGTTGAVFQVYDKLHLDRVPRRYTVEAGKTLTDEWFTAPDQGEYALWILGPNGFHREFRGNMRLQDHASVAIELAYDAKNQSIGLRALSKTARCTLVIRANAYRNEGPWSIELLPGRPVKQRWSLRDTANWYDFTVSIKDDSSYLYRFAGRMETGEHGVSDPAMSDALLGVLAFRKNST